MFYAPATSDALLRLRRIWQWLHRGLHLFSLLLLPFSFGTDDSDTAADPDFWTT